MKLDIDYIERILTAVEEHPKSQMQQRDLLKAIGTDGENIEDEDKFYYHMKRIDEVGYLQSSHLGSTHIDGFGFDHSIGRGRSLVDTSYELTWNGCEFLEAMRNDTVKNKITDWFKGMTLDQIKSQAPVLLTGLIAKGFN